jgi:diguanylate cyclase (GGDEF)-like protein
MRYRWCDRARQLRSVRTWQLLQLPRWLVAFVVIVAAADVAAIVVAATGTVGRPADFLIFLGLTACAAATVEITRRAGETALFIKDVCGVWELPIAILLPPIYALTAPILRLALTQWRVRKIEPHRRVFTAAAISLSYGSVYLVFHEINRQTVLSLTGTKLQAAAWLVVVAGCAAVQWVVNHGLVFTAVKGSDPTASIWQMLRAKESVQNDLIEGCVATLVTLGVAISPIALFFALPFVTLLQRSGRHAQLVNDSRIDAKTGLLNASTWRRESSAEVTRAVRTGSELAVALIDIDHFKAVNDSHGHLAGDEVLAAIGRTLLHLLREYDLVGRFGGEEFALVLPQTDLADARRIAERIRSQIADLRVDASSDPEAEPIRLTVSIGLATLSSAGEQLTELLAAADAAMYRAKGAGRNRVWVASEMASAAGPG